MQRERPLGRRSERGHRHRMRGVGVHFGRGARNGAVLPVEHETVGQVWRDGEDRPWRQAFSAALHGSILQIVARGDVGVGDVHIVVGIDDHGGMFATDLVHHGLHPTSAGVGEVFQILVATIGSTTGPAVVAADVHVIVGVNGHAQPHCVTVCRDEGRRPTSTVSDRHVDVVFAVVMTVHNDHFVL